MENYRVWLPTVLGHDNITSTQLNTQKSPRALQTQIEKFAQISPYRGHPMADTGTHAASNLPEALTVREQEILSCLFEGLSNQEIANHLYLAVTTVRWYNSQIYSKLGVSNREAALAVAESLGLLQTGSDTTADWEIQTNLPLQTTTFICSRASLCAI